MTKEEKELQEEREKLLIHIEWIIKHYMDKLSIPEVQALRTLHNFEILIIDNLRLMDELEQKEGEKE